MVVETLYEVQPISVAGVHPECIRILQYEAVESYPHCESKSGVLLSQMTSLAALAFPSTSITISISARVTCTFFTINGGNIKIQIGANFCTIEIRRAASNFEGGYVSTYCI